MEGNCGLGLRWGCVGVTNTIWRESTKLMHCGQETGVYNDTVKENADQMKWGPVKPFVDEEGECTRNSCNQNSTEILTFHSIRKLATTYEFKLGFDVMPRTTSESQKKKMASSESYATGFICYLYILFLMPFYSFGDGWISCLWAFRVWTRNVRS